MIADPSVNPNRNNHDEIEYPVAVILQNEGETVLVRKASIAMDDKIPSPKNLTQFNSNLIRTEGSFQVKETHLERTEHAMHDMLEKLITDYENKERQTSMEKGNEPKKTWK